MFHHDLRHTGLSQFDTSADTGIQKWIATIEGSPYDVGSPVVGADGTVYVSSNGFTIFDSGLTALNPDGTEKWFTQDAPT